MPWKKEETSIVMTMVFGYNRHARLSILPGFIRDVVCNDLPTVILFTDQQIDNLVKFCCLKKQGFVSELGVDLTFQLGPFYLLVTCYKNT